MRHRGVTVWFTGLSGAGKTTIAERVEGQLRLLDCKVETLDGDVVRTNLSKGLGFSREDRDTNIRRIGFVSHLLTRNGVIVLSAAISPFRNVRDELRSLIGDFVEVYVSTPLEVCAGRDVKGLYKRAMAGEIPQFTGVSDPYEPPLAPELTLDTLSQTADESAEEILRWLREHDYIDGAAHYETAPGRSRPVSVVW
ncbi:MAG: adenylyl-sulfate kinase [candidate division Zixibacteria bacterium]|nr:adenylyl-sulfate kinase [candidate division Zixibacteria bacterium]